jgi:AraC-like DNA-binding protein
LKKRDDTGAIASLGACAGSASDAGGAAVEEAHGVLDATTALTKFRLSRHPPAARLTQLIEYYWIVTWDLRGEDPYEQLVVPGPSVHMTFEPDGARITGVMTGRFSYWLRGADRVLGVRFRPGGFRPFLGPPVSAITDCTLGLSEIFGAEARSLERKVRQSHDEHDMIAAVDNFLLQRAQATPDRSHIAARAARAVQRIAEDRSMTAVDDLARWAGVRPRSLQRLFAEYVGVGPKWVIRRYRIYDALERAATTASVDWVRLATDLGYSDQAHFSREFTSIVGTSPTRYAKNGLRPRPE